MMNKIREWNNTANEKGFNICIAAWASGCYDIYNVEDCNVPEYADVTSEFVEDFIKNIA